MSDKIIDVQFITNCTGAKQTEGMNERTQLASSHIRCYNNNKVDNYLVRNAIEQINYATFKIISRFGLRQSVLENHAIGLQRELVHRINLE